MRSCQSEYSGSPGQTRRQLSLLHCHEMQPHQQLRYQFQQQREQQQQQQQQKQQQQFQSLLADDCLSPSSSVVNLLQTHNPAPMTAWSTAQPAFRRVNSQEARMSPMMAQSASSVIDEAPTGYQNQLGQAVRRRNASGVSRSPGYHSYVRQLQQPQRGGVNSAWDPPDPLSNLRRSCSAATLPHSFRTGGGSQYNLFNQQPQQPQQQIPDKLLNLYYQAGPQDKKPFSYTADNQQLERELQDAFMRRRRSRPRYRSTSTEVGSQQPAPLQQHQQYPMQRYGAQPYYERSASLVTQDRTGGYNDEATRRCANDITRYFADQTAQSTTDEAYWTGPVSSGSGGVGGAGRGDTNDAFFSPHTQPNTKQQHPQQQQQQQQQQLRFPPKQERKVSTSSVTLSCQPGGQFNARQQKQQQQQQQQKQQFQQPQTQPSGNQSFRVLQWLSNSSEMQNSSVRDEVQQKLSRAGVHHQANSVAAVAPPMSPGVSYNNHQPHQQQQQQQQQHQFLTQPRNTARLSSSVSDLRTGMVGGPSYQRLNSQPQQQQQQNSRAASTMGRSRQQQRQQQQRQEAPDPFEAIRATIRANQQARGQQQAVSASDPGRSYRLERNAIKEKPDELSHNAKFQRIRDKILQQPAVTSESAEGQDEQSDFLREERVNSAARVKELKQIQQQFNRQTISNGDSSNIEHQPQQQPQQELVSRAGLTEF